MTNLLEIAGMVLIVAAAFAAFGVPAALLSAGVCCLVVARQRVHR